MRWPLAAPRPEGRALHAGHETLTGHPLELLGHMAKGRGAKYYLAVFGGPENGRKKAAKYPKYRPNIEHLGRG